MIPLSYYAMIWSIGTTVLLLGPSFSAEGKIGVGDKGLAGFSLDPRICVIESEVEARELANAQHLGEIMTLGDIPTALLNMQTEVIHSYNGRKIDIEVTGCLDRCRKKVWELEDARARYNEPVLTLELKSAEYITHVAAGLREELDALKDLLEKLNFDNPEKGRAGSEWSYAAGKVTGLIDDCIELTRKTPEHVMKRRAARAERQILSWFREGINAINKWALMTPKQLSQVGDYHALVEEMRPTIARNPDLLRKEKHQVRVKIRRMLGYTCSQAYAGCSSAASYVPEELPERDPEESADGQRFIDLVRQFKSLDSELEKNDTMRTTHYKMLELQSQIIDKWAAFKDKQQGVPDIADVLLDDWVVVGNSTLGYMGCGLHD